MTHSQFFSALKATDIPFAYHHFESPQELPFGVWGVDGEPDFVADNTHYLPITSGYVEFYSVKKDIEGENKIKKAFTDNNIPYSFVHESYIESEDMFVVRYAVNFIGG